MKIHNNIIHIMYEVSIIESMDRPRTTAQIRRSKRSGLKDPAEANQDDPELERRLVCVWYGVCVCVCVCVCGSEVFLRFCDTSTCCTLLLPTDFFSYARTRECQQRRRLFSIFIKTNHASVCAA
jgi:hypothetical protein